MMSEKAQTSPEEIEKINKLFQKAEEEMKKNIFLQPGPQEEEVVFKDLKFGNYILEQVKKPILAGIRPCTDNPENKTHLGFLLGQAPIDAALMYNKSKQTFRVSFTLNPIIFVLDLGRCVYGCESFWGIIRSPEELKQITNDDIDNLWYIKSLKAAFEKEAEQQDKQEGTSNV